MSGLKPQGSNSRSACIFHLSGCGFVVVLAAVSDGFALDCGGFKSCKVLSWLGLKKKKSIGITSDLLHLCIVGTSMHWQDSR